MDTCGIVPCSSLQQPGQHVFCICPHPESFLVSFPFSTSSSSSSVIRLVAAWNILRFSVDLRETWWWQRFRAGGRKGTRNTNSCGCVCPGRTRGTAEYFSSYGLRRERGEVSFSLVDVGRLLLAAPSAAAVLDGREFWLSCLHYGKVAASGRCVHCLWGKCVGRKW